MIGNAHIDPVWLWQWQEGFHEVRASFRSALDRMKEYPDFIFVASSAAFYEWVEGSDPALFAEIQSLGGEVFIPNTVRGARMPSRKSPAPAKQ